jgi:hypothetical protein
MFYSARAATTVTCILLDVDQHVDRFDKSMAQLDRWLDEAMATLPRGKGNSHVTGIS